MQVSCPWSYRLLSSNLLTAAFSGQVFRVAVPALVKKIRGGGGGGGEAGGGTGGKWTKGGGGKGNG